MESDVVCIRPSLRDARVARPHAGAGVLSQFLYRQMLVDVVVVHLSINRLIEHSGAVLIFTEHDLTLKVLLAAVSPPLLFPGTFNGMCSGKQDKKRKYSCSR